MKNVTLFKLVLCVAMLAILLSGICTSTLTPTFAQTAEDFSDTTDLPNEFQFLMNGDVIETSDAMLPVLYALEDLNLKFNRQPGWHHSLTIFYNAFQGDHTGKRTEGLFPNWQTEDHWVGVKGPDGELGLGSYTVISNRAGERIQVVASDASGRGGNLTLIERDLENAFGSQSAEDPQAFLASIPTKMGSQLTGYIAQIISSEESLESIKAWVEIENELPVLKIMRTIRYDKPLDFDEYPQPYIGFNYLDSLSLENGSFLYRKADMVYESGDSVVFFMQMTDTVETIDNMPLDVHDRYLADVERVEALRLEKQEPLVQPNANLDVYYNYVGQSAAYASSTNSVANDTQMFCNGISQIVPPVVINTLGGTWMGCTQKCRDAYGQDTTMYTRTVPGWAYTLAYYNKSVPNNWRSFPSGSTSIQVTQTTHDFFNSGSSQWRPYTDYFGYQN